jgi:CHAT domain-containing protein
MQAMAPAAAYALARLGEPARAVQTLELGRAQLLGESLEQNRRDLELLPARGYAPLHERYLASLAERRRLEDPAATVPGDRLAAIEAVDRAFDAVIDEIRTVPGYEDFYADPTFAQIQAAAHAGPLVYLLATEAGGLALIVHGGEGHKPSFSEKLGLPAPDLPGSSKASGKVTDTVETVWLEGFTAARLREWLVGPADDPALGGWLGAYQAWQTQPTAAARQSPLSILESPPTVTLIPTGLLALLPLHAALRTARRAVTERTYFLDCFDVAYAPSATSLYHAQTLAAQMATPAALLAVDEPSVTGAGRLPNSAAEVTAIADLFAAPQVLRHAAATRDAVLAALPSAPVAHFSCHGSTNWQDALQSGLLLAEGAWLTVGDLLDKRLPGARLITLSACETGIVGTKLPDETVALPAALTQAGFAGVAASLWSVYDISTAMLMVRFYELWRTEGRTPPAALAAAQRWVRDTTNAEKAAHFSRDFLPGGARMSAAVAEPFFEAVFQAGDGAARTFADPVWWAAFTFTGA